MFFGCLPCCGEVQGSCPEPLSLSGLRIAGQAQVSFSSHTVTYPDGNSGTMPANGDTFTFAHTFSSGNDQFNVFGTSFLYPMFPGLSAQQGLQRYVLRPFSSSYISNGVFGFVVFVTIDSQFVINTHQKELTQSLLHRPCGEALFPNTEYLLVVTNDRQPGDSSYSLLSFNGQDLPSKTSYGFVTRDLDLPPLATIDTAPLVLTSTGTMPPRLGSPAGTVIGEMTFSMTIKYDELYWVLDDGSELPAFRWGFAGIEWQQ